MKASDIRSKWLHFFESKGHRIEPSAPLVPHNDPTLLWINAGMAPLKAYFDGRVKPDNPRIANSQKCIRTNDIENVGKTRRHHTFFEMLGNFSIGDYFKKEAILWAWEFLTSKQWIGFDPERLSVTIHPDDDEAFQYWNELVGIPATRIYKLKDNFWDIGEGPCGPCTEIFYDRGPKYGDLTDPECIPGGENERFLEVWNLVFSQFNHNADGTYTPLPNKNIDTGAGLERFASILQDVDSNFDTDLFLPIIEATATIAGVRYGIDPDKDVALKVIADHVRTVVFSVGDGVLPSNEGRGYVIRRLLRRAVRYGKATLGVQKPFMYGLTAVVGEIMGVYYPEVVSKREFIERVIRMEEERFHETLNEGLAILAAVVHAARSEQRTTVTGAEAFKLYDTYGFPLDLTEDYAAEHGMIVDRVAFETAMDQQRERARAARQDVGSMKVQGGALADFATKSEFVGYTELVTTAKVIAIVHHDVLVDEVNAGEKIAVLLDRTPFYAESGGQVSDTGTLSHDRMTAQVERLAKAPHGQHIHYVMLEQGVLRVGDEVTAAVQNSSRESIIKNHTATHLLHRALKEVLGEHVNQAGSLVEPDRLRFDFSHIAPIQDEELARIERIVNEQIWLGTALTIQQMAIDDAKELGAMALFGEKYGDVVRVVQVGGYSVELCGGCHVQNTSQIGLFKIVSENGIGSGIRRIEAVTGKGAYLYLESQLQLLQDGALLLRANPVELPKRIEALQQQLKEASKEIDALRGKMGALEAGSLEQRVRLVGDIPLLVSEIKGADMDTLRGIADTLKAKLDSVVIVLGSGAGDKVHLVAAVTPDWVKKGVSAGVIVKEAAAICGGGGGGRPDMAQAGGKLPHKLPEALQQIEHILINTLKDFSST
jgi:alanyl-tRNA synthetase